MNNKNSDHGYETGDPGPGGSFTPPQQQQEVQAPVPAFAEQTLAVDLARVEIDQLVATAHRFPRKIKTAMEKFHEQILYSEATAEISIYALPRAGRAITGPSVWFANTLASCWGNCWDYGRWIHTDRREKVVVAEGIYVDWESNRRLVMTEQRRIVDRKGRLFSDDMIIITSKAAQQIARRNVILNAIPRMLYWPVFEKALYIVRGSQETLPERRAKAIAAFAQFGVTAQTVMMYLNVAKAEEIGIEHIPTLRGMYEALRNGDSTVEEMFDPRRMTGMAFDQVDNPLADAEEDEETTPTNAATTQGSGWNPPPLQQQQEQKPEEQGIWKGVRKPSHQESTQARQEPVSAAAASAIPTQAPAPKAHPAPPKAAERPSFTALTEYSFTAPAEYYEYAKAWISASKSAADIDDRWKGERTLRNGLELPLDEDQQGELTELRKARMAELAGGRQ